MSDENGQVGAEQSHGLDQADLQTVPAPDRGQAPDSQPGSSPGLAEIPDWRDLLEQRRFNAAKKAYLVAKYAASGMAALDTGADDDSTRAALTALADVEDLLRERRYKKALERLTRFEARPTIAPWHALEADLAALVEVGSALDRRDGDEAMAQLEPLAATWFRAEALTLQGTAQIYIGDPDAAKDSFEDALAIDPEHYRALTNLGNLELEEGDVDVAIQQYERAIKINDQFANAHHNLGVALRRKGQVAKSVRQLRRAQRLTYRQDAADARESFTGGLRGRRAGSLLKWVMWVAIGAVVWWVLRSQGIL